MADIFHQHYDRPDDIGGPGVILHQHGGHSVEILLNGARVVSWMTSGQENIFQINLEPPRGGGIRIDFPKMFNSRNHGLIPGFGKSGRWTYGLRTNEDTDMPAPHDNDVFADFTLDHTRVASPKYANWPNKFEVWLRVILGPTGELSMISRIKNVNTDGRSFTFSFSYQNHFSVSDIGDVRIEGLEGRDYYLNHMRNGQRFNQGDEFVTFNSEVYRVYLNAPNRIVTMDDRSGRTFTIEKSPNLPDIVVWNPWDEYKEMVSVGAAAYDNEITLMPDQEWMAEQHLSVTELN